MLILDDFVMLGTTVPEPNSDGRVFVCSAGYSATLRSLVRVYPLARVDAPRRWSVNTVRLERNPKDWRTESYRLVGDRSVGSHALINRAFTATGEVAERSRAELLRKCEVESIAEADKRRLSLAIVKPRAMAVEFEHNASSPDSPQVALFELPGGAAVPQGARRFPFIPRLSFVDGDGTRRAPMLRDWGVYERMRKQPGFADWTESERRRHMASALHLDESCSLLVGNLNNQRNAWLIISVLRGLRAAPELPLDDLIEAA